MLGFPTAAHTAVPLRASSLCHESQVHSKYYKHACTPERDNMIHSVREMFFVPFYLKTVNRNMNAVRESDE